MEIENIKLDKNNVAFNQADEPFGGVQMLLIGDTFQLPPIVTNDELNYD